MKKILIIDDQPIMCRHLADQLNLQFDIEADVKSEYIYLDKWFEKDYNAVVLDVMMPFDEDFFKDEKSDSPKNELTTGILLFRKIRRKSPKMPVIFYTAICSPIECDERTIIIRKPDLASRVAKTINAFIEQCDIIKNKG